MPFNLQPTLQGRLLSMRPLHRDDFDALYAVASDPLIWEQHPAWDRYQEPVFRKLFAESLASGGCLIATDNETGKVIGSSRYHDYNPEANDIEIGWSYLARAYWGGVYNREMKKLMLDHAFRFVDSVIFVIGVDNLRSQKAIEKFPSIRESEFRTNATGSESCVYRITAQAWREFDRPESE